CSCSTDCLKVGDCCANYNSICKAQLWTCTKFRCGEKRHPHSLCSCSTDCLKVGDCCANYNSICKGEKSWQEQDCEETDLAQCPSGFSKPPVILFSLDGFRAEYLKKWGRLMPAISKLKKCGTFTDMRPVYPTKTFPNHYTIVTGLYPESHGIVDNHMYDVTRNATFGLKLPEKFNKDWYQGQPIWLTAMYNRLKAATFFWPGSDVAINGTYPNFHIEYNRSIAFEERVATVFRWLSLPEAERAQFYTLYLEEPDASGHWYGPVSSEVIIALKKVDQMVGLLMDGLKQRDLHRCVNLILVSDHGMEEASCKTAEYVSNYMDVDDFTVIQGPAARIRPNNLPQDYFTFNYEGVVKNLSCRSPDQHLKPYLKHHLPKRFHFANNVRIEKAHLYMKQRWQAAVKPRALKYCKGGFHGSDNMFSNMQAIFIGYGPEIKSKTAVAPFENIEVYNLLCDLLKIPPAPNNGTHGSLNHILKKPFYNPTYPAELSPPLDCSQQASTVDDLGCSCTSYTKSQVERLNQQLFIVESEISKAETLHLPYGHPRVLQRNARYCVLNNVDYISGYSQDLFMPLWTAYTIHVLTNISSLKQERADCLRADPRILPVYSQTCTSYKNNKIFKFGFFYPPNFGPSSREPDSLITSNIVPMYNAFKDVWTYIHDTLIGKYSRERNGLNVISGPVFDYDFNGHFDTKDIIQKNVTDSRIPIPTHYFLILTSCMNSSFSPAHCEGPLEAVSFVLPHRPDNSESCATGENFLWVEDWLKFHVVRVRDIELLTGLSFYHKLGSVTETLQLKTFLQTFQSED
ncbi:ENPP3 phosphodiesterase, partial [Amia calva]|nr:ENPP3 phosphodiesterase [Amia calva]